MSVTHHVSIPLQIRRFLKFTRMHTYNMSCTQYELRQGSQLGHEHTITFIICVDIYMSYMYAIVKIDSRTRLLGLYDIVVFTKYVLLPVGTAPKYT